MTATTAISKKISKRTARNSKPAPTAAPTVDQQETYERENLEIPKPRRVITLPEPRQQREVIQNSLFFDGPFSDGGESTHDGDERPFWTIKVAVDMDAEAKYAYKIWSFEKATNLANKIAEDQRIEIISSAVSAR